jgi:hypothetical protein
MKLERRTGIEPASRAWKARALPLDDLRVPSPRIERELPALQAGVQADYTSSAKNGGGGENCTLRAPGVEPGSDRYERPVLPLNEARSKWSGRRGSNPHPHLGKVEFSAVEPRPRNWWTRSESNRGLPGANRRLSPIELQAPNCKTNIAAPAAAITLLAPSARASTNLPGRLR